jgi:hypothetical protein
MRTFIVCLSLAGCGHALRGAAGPTLTANGVVGVEATGTAGVVAIGTERLGEVIGVRLGGGIDQTGDARIVLQLVGDFLVEPSAGPSATASDPEVRRTGGAAARIGARVGTEYGAAAAIMFARGHWLALDQRCSGVEKLQTCGGLERWSYRNLGAELGIDWAWGDTVVHGDWRLAATAVLEWNRLSRAWLQ